MHRSGEVGAVALDLGRPVLHRVMDAEHRLRAPIEFQNPGEMLVLRPVRAQRLDKDGVGNHAGEASGAMGSQVRQVAIVPPAA